MNTSPALAREAAPEEKGRRDRRELLPLWRITGQITLLTPLSIGSGRDLPITITEKDEAGHDRHVVGVMRDHQKQPYLPGSGLKGALLALARRNGLDDAVRKALFGDDAPAADNKARTRPGRVEFTDAWVVADTLPAESELPNWEAEDHPHTANLPHVGRDRVHATAKEQILFLEQVVPPGVAFRFECTARALNENAIAALLGLLALAGDPAGPFRLGGGKAADQGRIAWRLDEVRRLDSAAPLWQALSNDQPADLWRDPISTRVNLSPRPLAVPIGLNLEGLTLRFHTPFLVHQAQPKGAEVNGKPRRDHDGRLVLPADSLRGALRARAERILRSLGLPAAPGYDQKDIADLKEAAKLDLAGLLFGAPGWASPLRLGDFTGAYPDPTPTQDMVAIDRLTGGGKDSAKFRLQVCESPSLSGSLALDPWRLEKIEQKRPGVTAQVLGLLAHTLRDLDEGDIPLGYGAAKGYGRCRAETVPRLAAALPSLGLTLETALTAFAQLAGPAPAYAPPPSTTPVLQPDTPLATSTGDFHNPYAFIPFGKPRPDDPRLPWAEYGDDMGPHSHDRLAPGSYHGRLVCRLTTVTPTFVGAGAKPNSPDPKLQLNYRYQGRLALPATSLRGMLSSLHETITGSRPRVVGNGYYSMRKAAGDDDVLSAVGRVLRVGGRYWLQMLALPTLKASGTRFIIPKEYRALLPRQAGAKAPLKSLVWDKDHPLQNNVYRSYSISSGDRWFLADHGGMQIHDADAYLYLEPADETHLHIKEEKGKRFLLGIRRLPGDEPIHKDQLAELTPRHPNALPERGILRIMSTQGRDLVKTRKHELFLPFTLEQGKVDNELLKHAGKKRMSEVTLIDIKGLNLTQDHQLLPIPEEVVERFYRLADEMTETQDNKDELADMGIRPYHPADTKRNPGRIDKVYAGNKPGHWNRVLRLKHGDLVFFRPNADGDAIAEIAFSSIWRRGVGEEIVSFLDPHLRPLGTEEAWANRLSPTELLFGALEIREGDAQAEGSIRAHAGKLYIGHGQALTEPVPMPEVTLKILSSPKPPSPALYFTPAKGNARYIAKADLAATPDAFRLKGRKTYLHPWMENGKPVPLDRQGQRGSDAAPPWQSQAPDRNAPAKDREDYERSQNQRVRVTPIPPEVAFYFPIDFHNLAPAELESLCACLVPHPEHRHRLGMGKPLGLGTVKLEILGLYLLDPAARYRQRDFTAPRYAAVWQAGASNLPKEMEREQTAQPTPGAPDPHLLAQRQMAELKKHDPAVYNALRLLGDPAAVRQPVHYPQLEGLDLEKETFQWFVNNDKPTSTWDGEPQHLEDITDSTGALPGLGRKKRVEKKLKVGR